jgi:hypothetical protein
LMRSSDADLDDRDRLLLDRVAALTVAGDATFAEIRELYESDERLRVRPVVFNVDRDAPEAVAR